MRCYLTHLECAACGRVLSADALQNLCPECGETLLARYDMDALRALRRDEMSARRGRMWRWFEALPVRDPNNIVSLGEGATPLIHAERLGKRYGAAQLYIKDESGNPTGSFKARGLSTAVSKAKELGAPSLVIPTAGNAGGALAAYAARAGIPAAVYMPNDAPETMRREAAHYGAAVHLTEGTIADAGREARKAAAETGAFDISTLKEPYRVEGKKTMGVELAEQFGWELPDAVLYPAGGGTGIVGMWKAFEEMEALGWIGAKRPKMCVVQSKGCAPIVRAFREGKPRAEPWENPQTAVPGIRVPSAIGDFLILNAVRKSGGSAVAVSDEAIAEAVQTVGREEGVCAAPEGAAALAGYAKLLETGAIERDECVVLFNTGSGLKTPEWMTCSN